MKTKTNKIYSKQTLVNWLHWFFDLEDKHLTLRLAGNPSILLDYYRKESWVEWEAEYIKLLGILDKIWNDWLSPFVMYVNERLDLKKKEITNEPDEEIAESIVLDR